MYSGGWIPVPMYKIVGKLPGPFIKGGRGIPESMCMGWGKIPGLMCR